MGDVGNPAVWGLLGTVVGAATSIGTTWLANALASKLEDNKHKAVRMETARDFHRKTLSELQEATHMLVRLVSRAHLHDRRAFAGGAQWRTDLLPDELSEEISDPFRLVTFLT